jgi:hypothetical protein
MLNQLKSRLNWTVEEYEKRKMYFVLDVKTQVDSDTFEQNAISTLLEMQKLKTKIIEYNQLIEMMELALDLQEVSE